MSSRIFRSRVLVAALLFSFTAFVGCEKREVAELGENAFDRQAPTVPDGLTASDITETSILISWEASADNEGIKRYVVYRNMAQVSHDSLTTYEANGLESETNYSFTVRAVDIKGNISDFSPEIIIMTAAKGEPFNDITPPAIPEDLAFSNTSTTTTNLDWDDTYDNVGVSNYKIFQGNQYIGTVTSSEYQVTGLSPDTSYNFSISALDAAGNESEKSLTVSVTTGAEVSNPLDKILIFTKTSGFRHGSIAKGVTTFTELGSGNNFEIVQTENASDFNLLNLQEYQLVVFLNTTGDVLDAAQQTAFENYIQAGGSFMGVHSATDTEYDWPWYEKLVGAYFDGHPSIQEATIDTIDTNHASTEHLATSWVRTDEWYNFKNINPNINVLMNLDESSYTGGTNGGEHPIAWYHEYDGGRSFYTAGGHTESSYDEPDFRQHLLGGILYCLERQ